MIIYKVRAWMDITKRGGKKEREYTFEEVVVDDKQTALRLYDEQEKRLRNHSNLVGGYSGKAQLCIPHVYADGRLAYWGDADKNNGNEYLKEYELEQ